MRSLKIVVAEDDFDTRAYLAELLERLGHQVVAAVGDGTALVEACRRASVPDVVVTDWRLPGLDGLAAAAAVVRERPVGVVLVTGSAPSELPAGARDLAVAVLGKPVKPDELQAAVERAARSGVVPT